MVQNDSCKLSLCTRSTIVALVIATALGCERQTSSTAPIAGKPKTTSEVIENTNFPDGLTYLIAIREVKPNLEFNQPISVKDAVGTEELQKLDRALLHSLPSITTDRLKTLASREALEDKSVARVMLKFSNGIEYRSLSSVGVGNGAVDVSVPGHKGLRFTFDEIAKESTGHEHTDWTGQKFSVWQKDFELVSNAGESVLRGTLLCSNMAMKSVNGNTEPKAKSPQQLPESDPVSGEFDVDTLAPDEETKFTVSLKQPSDSPDGRKPASKFSEELFRVESTASRPEPIESVETVNTDSMKTGYSISDDGEMYTIAAAETETKNNLSTIITHASTVFPGQLLNGKKLTELSKNGVHVEAVSFGKNSRNSLAYATDYPTDAGFEQVNSGDLGFDPDDENLFNTRVLAVAKSTGKKVSTNVDIAFGSFNSSGHLKTKLGISANGWGFDGEFDSVKAASRQESVVFVLIRQRMFDILVTNPPNGVGEFFKQSKEYSAEADGIKFQNACPLLYVNRVHYGKIALLLVRGKGSSADVSIAVKASFSGWGVTAKTDFNDREKKAAESLQGSLFVHGGDPAIAEQIQTALSQINASDEVTRKGVPMDKIMGQVLQYFSPSAEASSAQPIGFTAKYIYDGTDAVCIAATHSKTCIVTPAPISYWVYLRSLDLREDGGGVNPFHSHGDWHIAAKQTASTNWLPKHQTGLMPLHDIQKKDLSNHSWAFVSPLAIDSITIVAGDNDKLDDKTPVDESNYMDRWNSDVSINAFTMNINFMEALTDGDPVDSKGNSVDPTKASYRKLEKILKSNNDKNTLEWGIKVQVPEKMRQSELSKVLSDLTADPLPVGGTSIPGTK